MSRTKQPQTAKLDENASIVSSQSAAGVSQPDDICIFCNGEGVVRPSLINTGILDPFTLRVKCRPCGGTGKQTNYDLWDKGWLTNEAHRRRTHQNKGVKNGK